MNDETVKIPRQYLGSGYDAGTIAERVRAATSPDELSPALRRGYRPATQNSADSERVQYSERIQKILKSWSKLRDALSSLDREYNGRSER